MLPYRHEQTKLPNKHFSIVVHLNVFPLNVEYDLLGLAAYYEYGKI